MSAREKRVIGFAAALYADGELKGNKTMKAVRFYAKEDVRVEDVRPPDALGDSQVLIKPRTCGICGTDLHEFAGGPIVTPGRRTSSPARCCLKFSAMSFPRRLSTSAAT